MRKWRELFQRISPTEPDTALEEIAQQVVRDRMSTAAIAFLESVKPMTFLAGQSAILATPILGGFIEPMKLEKYADLFSDRDFIERLIIRIEELEAEQAGARKPKAE